MSEELVSVIITTVAMVAVVIASILQVKAMRRDRDNQ